MAFESDYYVGIDVGSGSVRAAVIDNRGKLLHLDVEPIETWNPEVDIYQQSTADIWKSICKTVRMALQHAGVSPSFVKGVGFDATCSLVVVDKAGEPLSVDEKSKFEDHRQNVILWADHRAVEQARCINATQHAVLKYVGSTISPEMEIPKTLWLKEHLPQAKWDAIGHLFDMPDYLTYRATGSLARSTCSLTCKWSYLPKGVGSGWESSYFASIGLECLNDERWARLGGSTVLYAGDRVAQGLTETAAADLGLMPGTPVGSAVIDAYAGAMATLGGQSSSVPSSQDMQVSLSRRLAIICGTSSCHIAIAPEPIFVPGVWGPYHSVIVPDQWCAEGGQSSTGQLIDHIIETHPATGTAKEQAASQHISIYTFLNQHLETLRQKRQCRLEDLTKHVHIYPDFHGNRSPLADPSLRGTLVGMSLDKGLDDLAVRYLATLQAIACQTRHILESLNEKGYTIDTLCLSGGLCKNEVFVAVQANVTQCRVILPECIDGAVVIGAAFLGAQAARQCGMWKVMRDLGRAGPTILPSSDKATIATYERRYRVFHALLEDQKKYQLMMES